MELSFDQSAFNMFRGELNTELRRARGISDKYTKVGYSVRSGLIEGEEGKTLSNLTKVALAVIHEFGTDKIPERPFMRQAFDNRLNEIEDMSANLHARYLNGDLAEKQALAMLGEWFMGEIKEEIRKGNFTPIKPSTAKRKGSSKPLIDSGLNLLGGLDHEEVV